MSEVIEAPVRGTTTMRCIWCGERKPAGQFYRNNKGTRSQRCGDCVYQCKQTPKPTDPARTRECWRCGKNYASTDFSSRYCSPSCRAQRTKKKAEDVQLTPAEKARAKRAMKAMGMRVGRQPGSFVWPKKDTGAITAEKE